MYRLRDFYYIICLSNEERVNSQMSDISRILGEAWVNTCYNNPVYGKVRIINNSRGFSPRFYEYKSVCLYVDYDPDTHIFNSFDHSSNIGADGFSIEESVGNLLVKLENKWG